MPHLADKPALPTIPAALDDALYDALRGVVGADLAFAAVDAVWEALVECRSVCVLEIPSECGVL